MDDRRPDLGPEAQNPAYRPARPLLLTSTHTGPTSARDGPLAAMSHPDARGTSPGRLASTRAATGTPPRMDAKPTRTETTASRSLANPRRVRLLTAYREGRLPRAEELPTGTSATGRPASG